MKSVIEYRKALHRIPELGRKEYETKKYLVNVLKNFTCEIHEPTPTSVVAYFNLQKSKTICFRADMDALPIKETTGLPFESNHQGLCHACGHDGHMAMLLAYAEWASKNLDKLTVNVVCLFQHSEEDKAGAKDIIKSGILETLNVSEVYGFHIWPRLKENKIFSMAQGILACSGELNIDFHGNSVHAANRSDDIDALLIASKFLQEFYSETEKILEPHLVSIGKMEAGTIRNSVAGTAHLEGTLRAFNEEIFSALKRILYHLSEKYMDESQVKIEILLNEDYPCVINSAELLDKHLLNLDIHMLDKAFLQAEDFGWYTKSYPSLFMLLGCGDTPMLHSSNFDFNMDILDTGVAAYQKLSTQ